MNFKKLIMTAAVAVSFIGANAQTWVSNSNGLGLYKSDASGYLPIGIGVGSNAAANSIIKLKQRSSSQQYFISCDVHLVHIQLPSMFLQTAQFYQEVMMQN